MVVGVADGRPIYLKDVADVRLGPEEPSTYVWLGSGPAAPEKGLEAAGMDLPAVTLAVAKKQGTNAVDMVRELDERLAGLEGQLLPSDVHILKTRDYGATAEEKSNELLKHLYSATLAVILLMWITLSRREAIVVAVVVAGGWGVGPLRPLGHLLLMVTSVRAATVDGLRGLVRTLPAIFLVWLVAVANATHVSALAYLAASAVLGKNLLKEL